MPTPFHAARSRSRREGALARALAKDSPHWTPVHLDFVVDEIEPALLRAEQAGARREGGIREHDWGRYAVLSDPFGNGFCLLQFRGSGYDVLED